VTPINIYNPEYGLPADSLPSLSLQGVSPYKESNNYAALYVQDMITLWEDLRITLAGRYTSAQILGFEGEDETQDVGAFTPRAGISYSVNPSLAIYALYDQSFIPQSGLTRSGEKVKPLRGNNLEAGIKKDWFNNALSTTLAVYNIRKTNMLTPDLLTADSDDPSAPDYVIQRGEIQSQGLELDMFGKLTEELSLVFNYAYTDSRITEDTDETVKGQRVDGVARHNTNVWLKYQFQDRLLKGFGIGLGGRYLGDRAALTTYVDVEENKFPALDDWKQLDASLYYQKDDFRISLNVYNITNEKNYTGLPLSVLGVFYTQYSPPVNYRIITSIKF
jgi:iron complex outermembrane receptor protein